MKILALRSKLRNGPLGILKRICEIMQDRFNMVPGCRRLFLSLSKLLFKFHVYLDSAFDRKYGVDTSGVISFKDLISENKNIGLATWYEPMSERIFREIMKYLTISFSQFEFIDFGSGKGRVLILAAEYGFKKITGVEFLSELHCRAVKNVTIYERYIQKTSNIETICMDATEFPIPVAPLVVFFYSPFKGEVLGRVLNNLTTSFVSNPREIILLFYGDNPESIELFKATQFQCRELKLHADWSRFNQYRGFLFKAQNGLPDSKFCK